MTDRVAQAALDRALDEKEDLVLLYQPIHETRTRRVMSAEALLRQRRQTGEIREASIITATAEQGPELFVLDSILIKTAFADAARWPGIRLNINLSPREFQEGDLVGRLERCNIDPRKVNLEITETTYIERPNETMEILEELKKRGYGLWLDDFGTGHSSLAHLQHFPLDGLKIAGCFIAGVPHDHRPVAITRMLIELAHDLDMQVVAEGIENDGQLEFLARHECDYVQGFLLSSPMTIEDFTRSFAAGAAPPGHIDRAVGRDPS